MQGANQVEAVVAKGRGIGASGRARTAHDGEHVAGKVNPAPPPPAPPAHAVFTCVTALLTSKYELQLCAEAVERTQARRAAMRVDIVAVAGGLFSSTSWCVSVEPGSRSSRRALKHRARLFPLHVARFCNRVDQLRLIRSISG